VNKYQSNRFWGNDTTIDVRLICLQYFDAVGGAAGRASDL